jgi:putative phosphoserine phosphatase/1-acylglycerol-3-phosphate O-acyltransferase
MDRTLISVDTARLYTQFRRDRGEASLRDVIQVAWWAMQYTAGVIDAPRVAEQALTRFRGQSERWLIEQTEGWFGEYVLPEVQKAGREAVQRHKSEGHVVGIATGATIYAAGPLARELDIDLVICTELEVDSEGLFTGKVISPLCYAEGKLERSRRAAERLGFSLEESYFYTDSITDVPLIEAVKEPVIVNPDKKLRKLAKERGWRVEAW